MVDKLKKMYLKVFKIKWLEKAYYLERKFNSFHGDYINKSKSTVKNLTDKICKKWPDFPKEVISAFILQRTYIRIKRLNAQKANKRMTDNEENQTAKNMKKIVN